jgi:hypothetical protein
MSQGITSNKKYLESLTNTKNKMRVNIIRGGNKNNINSICECIYNVLKGNIKLTDQQKDSLKKYKANLRKLVKRSSLKQKKNILEKNNKFLLDLLPPVFLTLAENEIFNKNDSGPIQQQQQQN